jgi:hypothetical protein
MSKRKTQIDREIEKLDAEIQERVHLRARLLQMQQPAKRPQEGDTPFTPVARAIGK